MPQLLTGSELQSQVPWHFREARCPAQISTAAAGSCHPCSPPRAVDLFPWRLTKRWPSHPDILLASHVQLRPVYRMCTRCAI